MINSTVTTLDPEQELDINGALFVIASYGEGYAHIGGATLRKACAQDRIDGAYRVRYSWRFKVKALTAFLSDYKPRGQYSRRVCPHCGKPLAGVR